jgi:hypothetical protein
VAASGCGAVGRPEQKRSKETEPPADRPALPGTRRLTAAAFAAMVSPSAD